MDNPIHSTSPASGREPSAKNLLQHLPDPPKKIAILRATRIGDFINTFPAFKALRRALPSAEITLITLPMLRELSMRLPWIDRIVAFPGYPGIAEQLFDPVEALDFFGQMQAQQFDLAIQMQGSGVNANPFMLMLGAQFTAGFIRDGDPPGLLDAALPLPDSGHEVERMMALVNFIGVPAITSQPEIPIWEEDRLAAEDLLVDAAEPWIGIHTMARDPARRWALGRFAETASALQRRIGGTVIAIGEKDEREAVSGALNVEGVTYLNLCGLTSLPVTTAVISRLSVLVTNDTGPVHIAYALRTPTVTVFGGADPQRYGPLNGEKARLLVHPVSCRPCGYHECPIGNYCLDQISVDQVVEAALEVIQ